MEDRELRTGSGISRRDHLLFLLFEIERVAEQAAPELSADDVTNISARLLVVISKLSQPSV